MSNPNETIKAEMMDLFAKTETLTPGAAFMIAQRHFPSAASILAARAIRELLAEGAIKEDTDPRNAGSYVAA